MKHKKRHTLSAKVEDDETGDSDGIKGVFPKAWFERAAEISFEGRTYRVPVNYHEVLTRLYGDYMQLPPEEDRIAHHFYKAYKK